MIRTKHEMYSYMMQDRIMNKLSVSNIKNHIFNFIFPISISNFLYLLRKAEYYHNCKSFFCIPYYWYFYRFKKVSKGLGFSIPLNVCGPGLSIPHYGTIIISKNARIGSNCRIHACVNIGASAGIPEAPHIGNNVYIGPSAVLFGNIKIADNVTIGANSTVNKSCEVGSVVLAGTPARIVKENVRNWLDFNKVM